MFRALTCPSSGGKIVFTQHLVSSLSVKGCTVHWLRADNSHFHIFSNNISSCSQFVEACFGPFSAQLAKVGSYRALEKEAQDLIGALHEKLERRRRDLQTGLGVGVRSRIKLTTLELKVCYISVELIFTFL